MENSKETPKEKANRLGWLQPDGKEGGPGMDFKGLGNILLTAVISLVMAVLIVFLVAPTKGNLSEFKEDLESRFTAYTASMDTKMTEISGALDSKFAGYKTEISSILAGTEGRVNTLDSLVKSFDQRLSALAGLGGRLETAIAGIDTKVEDAIGEELEDYALKSDLDNYLEKSSYSGSSSNSRVIGVGAGTSVTVEFSTDTYHLLLVKFWGTGMTGISVPSTTVGQSGTTYKVESPIVVSTSLIVVPVTTSWVQPVKDTIRLTFTPTGTLNWISTEIASRNANYGW